MTPAPFDSAALALLWDVLPEARVVGGAVRDRLAKRPISDIDLATPRPPDQVAEALERAGLRVIPTGLAHGTVTALVEATPFEVTTLRRDVATDGRHAVVAFTDDWREDAARRDFTINAMSVDRQGGLHDYFGGAADLAAGRVRFVGEPALRIAEDYLRVLRYFRFFARYGSRPPDAETEAALAAGVPSLQRLSVERVWSELKRILGSPNPLAAVALMERLGVLAAVLPGPLHGERLEALIGRGAPAEPMLRLAALTEAPAALLARQLRMSSAEAARLAELRGPVPPENADSATLRRALAETAPDILLARGWLAGRDAIWRERLAGQNVPIFPLQGRDLLAAGIAPGPELGRRLQALHRDWLDGGCVAGRAALLAKLAPVVPP